eukprot:g68745.t1
MFHMWEEAFPPSAMVIIFFMAYLFSALRGSEKDEQGAPTGLKANTIFGYVAGLRSFCVDMGWSVAPFSYARVRRVRRAIKRARSWAPRRRLPITVQLAVKMIGVLLTGKHCTESVMLAAIITTCIYALLRSGEMVVKADSSSAPLRREHVQWDSEILPQWVDIFIEASKTDFCREGATLLRISCHELRCFSLQVGSGYHTHGCSLHFGVSFAKLGLTLPYMVHTASELGSHVFGDDTGSDS